MRLRKRKWVDPFLENEKEFLIPDLSQIQTELPIYLEIGMGMGDFLTQSAISNPDIFYIGLEKDATCVAKSALKAKELSLQNIKIIHADASHLEELISVHSIDRIYLHFSDPWPKKGHHKRRLTYPTFLRSYDHILKSSGDIIFKTDNSLLFADTLDYISESVFLIKEKDEDYHAIIRTEPMTGYESKFVQQGIPIYFLHLVKGNQASL